MRLALMRAILLLLVLLLALSGATPSLQLQHLPLLLLRDDLRDLSTSAASSSRVDDAALQSIVLGARQQQPEALYLLAVMRLYGHGVEQDARAAVGLLRSAAAQAHRDAEFALGVLHTVGGAGLPLSARMSAAWLSKSANRGHVDAKWMLAVQLSEGRGVDENVPRAVELLEEAVAAGNAHAQFHLGVLSEYGRGVPQDFARAAELYERASGARHPDAMYYLGLLFAQGRGVRQSFARAMELFLRAADGFDHAQAMFALGQMHARGEGTPADYPLALAWMQRAAQRQDPRVSAAAQQAAQELRAFLELVEARVRRQEAALGTPIRVSVAAIE